MVAKNKTVRVKEKLHEGSTKVVYYYNTRNEITLFFKDDLKLHNSDKIIHISGKGVVNNSISAFIMSALSMVGINNHFIEKLNMREQLIEYVEPIPVSISISNIAVGRYVKEYGFEEGFVFSKPLIEIFLKNIKDKNLSLINEQQLLALDIMIDEEISALKNLSLRINDFLTGLFVGVGIRLMEVNLEFGRTYDMDEDSVMLINDISLDSCKLLDISTNRRLDSEYASTLLSEAIEIYKEVASRLKISF